MKRTIYLLMSLSLLAWTLQGCSDNDNNETPPAQEPSITFPSGTDTQLTFESGGGTATLTFSATDDWTARVDDATDWLSASPASGQAGTTTLTLTAQANNTPDERNAAITLTCGNVRETLTATQKQQDALTVTSNKVELEATGGDFAIELQANVSVSYEIEESAKAWLTPTSDTRALTTTTLHFQAAANEDLQPRQGIITLNGGNGLTEDVTVYQLGSSPVLILTQDEYLVGSNGETIKVELKSNNTYQIEMPSVDWITEADTRALSTYTHYFTVAPNDTYDAREAVIRFVDEENGLEQTVSIQQMQRDAIVVAQSIYEIGAEGGALNFAVQANVDFTVSTDADWITQVETRGLTERVLHFDVAANESEEAREATIILSSESAGMEQMIKVYQAGKSRLQLSIQEYTASARGELFDVTVQSNAAYQLIMPEVDWLVHTASDGDAYTFEVLPNETYDARTAEIRFICEEEGLTETVTVTQMQRDAIVVAQSIYEIGAEGDALDFAVQANVDFTVSTNADWITQVETRGLTERVLHFDVAANESEEAREATITLHKEGAESGQEITVRQEGKTYLQLSVQEYTASAGGELFDVTVQSNAAYQLIMPEVDWLVHTASDGDAYTFEVLPNNTFDARTAEIRFICEKEGLSESLIVTQMQQNAIVITQDFYEVEAEGGTLDIPVQANVDFTVSTDADWITQVETRGLTERVLHFDVAANENEEAREATITLHKEGAESGQGITVRQEGKTYLQLSIQEYTASAGGELFDVTVQSNVAYQLIMPEVDWLVHTASNGGAYTFEVLPNNTFDARTAEIRFICEEEGLSENLIVTQMQQNAIVIAQDFYEVETEGGTLDISVQANVDFTVNTDADWITQVETRGLTERVLHFDVAENPRTDDRTAVITITSPNVTHKIQVVQRGKNPILKIISAPQELDNKEQEFVIVTESEMEYLDVNIDVYWIQLRDIFTEKSKGTYITTYKLSAESNTSSDVRSGQIVFSFYHNGHTVREIVTIMQGGDVSVKPGIDDMPTEEW